MINVNDLVTWSKRTVKGRKIEYRKFDGVVLSIANEVATVKQVSNNRKIDVHVTRLTRKSEDAPMSLVDRVKGELGLW